MLQQGLRAMGRQIFRSLEDFASTPLEDVQVLAHIGGRGPNGRAELSLMEGWLTRNAIRDDDALMNFSADTFGMAYAPRIQVWNALGYSFLLVKEEARTGMSPVDGLYIYAVASGRGVHLENDPVPEALPSP